MVKPGQNVTLQCQQSHPGTLTLLTWTRNDLQKDDFAFFLRENRPYRQYQHESFRGRVELRDSSSLKDGDFSVLLQNVSSEDAGTYRCRIVMRNPGGGSSEFEHFINLTVSGEETPEEGDEEGGGPKFGVMTLGRESIIALIISVFVLGMVLISFAAVQMKRKCRTPSTLDADADEEKTPMQSEMILIPSVTISSTNLPAMDAMAPVPISGSLSQTGHQSAAEQ
ncbi:PREDICTED: sodium channel subunit beta-2-like isoform X2 [Cyprinodon variegatus]|nr:PREDICTED: sodium channel subunit beta-2-like isoform X2 [Cyprinodon variegatus]